MAVSAIWALAEVLAQLDGEREGIQGEPDYRALARRAIEGLSARGIVFLNRNALSTRSVLTSLRVKQARLSLNLGPVEFARLVGISHPTLKAIEGGSKPSRLTQTKIRAALDDLKIRQPEEGATEE